MGANMARRLARGGVRVVAWDRDKAKCDELAKESGIECADGLADLAVLLTGERVILMMVPAGAPTQSAIDALLPLISNNDTLVDGGNSFYKDSMSRALELSQRGLRFVDAGVSGGIHGLANGYCLMVGGDPDAVALVEPAFRALAPEDGYAHVGRSGAGHFTKMVHNGIEYGLLAAYGEGFEILNGSDFDLDLLEIAGIWRYGSVVRSWLLELLHDAMENDPALEKIRGYVDDSGEGRWTIEAAMEENVPAPITSIALFNRFASRQEESFSAKVIAALRNEFGGHAVKEEGS